jgi:hypothetical protein
MSSPADKSRLDNGNHMLFDKAGLHVTHSAIASHGFEIP